MISLNIGILLSIGFSIIVIFYLILNHIKYGTKFISILFISIIFIVGILFQIILFFSSEFFFTELINRILFKFVIVIEAISLLIVSIAFSLLRQYGKIPMYSLLLFIFIFSLLIGTLISENSVLVQVLLDSSIKYSFNNATKIISLTYSALIIIFIIHNIRIIKTITPLKKFINGLIIYSIILFFSIILFLIYIITEILEVIFAFLFILWFLIIITGIIIIVKPRMFLSFTNKIYFIHIYHKTGILLYSYKFKKSLETIGESKVWGNILIGLNHILSEFTNKKDQIDVLKTKNADIYVNYNNKYGFAVLVLTNHKNSYIENCVNILTKEFKEYYEDELLDLQDINKIINVSEFKEAKKIIEKSFSLYL
ncbi:MAG: hypothetical protein KGD63_11065 [Candidatus Lokiarchaeota archaeon]|nr:hypothetical protein [Candidatus Lokiarchaeota archaeon]